VHLLTEDFSRQEGMRRSGLPWTNLDDLKLIILIRVCCPPNSRAGHALRKHLESFIDFQTLGLDLGGRSVAIIQRR